MASPLLRPRIHVPKKTAKKAAKKATKKTATKKRVTKKHVTKKHVTKKHSPARALTLKERTDQTIADIRAHLGGAEATYYDVGRALVSLRDPEIWKLYAETSFKGFLNAHVIPYTTAVRMIVVAESYSRDMALELGQERGFQLARLAKHHPKFAKQKLQPAQLWARNVELGNKRVKRMTGAEIAEHVKLAIMRAKAKKKKPPEPTDEDAQLYEELYEDLIEDWQELLGHEADFELDLEREVVRIEVDLAYLRKLRRDRG